MKLFLIVLPMIVFIHIILQGTSVRIIFICSNNYVLDEFRIIFLISVRFKPEQRWLMVFCHQRIMQMPIPIYPNVPNRCLIFEATSYYRRISSIHDIFECPKAPYQPVWNVKLKDVLAVHRILKVRWNLASKWSNSIAPFYPWIT